MIYAALLGCLALIWYAAAMTAASLAVAPLLGTAARIAEPSLRARRLVLLRSLPTVIACLVTGCGLLPAFVWLEPRQTTEIVSGPMLLIAAGAAAVIFAGPVQGIASLWATRRLVRGWERTARAVRVPGTDLPAFSVEECFPVVVVFGWRRPRLFVARRVLECCDGAEIAAIAAHELGHLHRRDHWKRLILRAAPDWISLVAFGGEIERRWEQAAEQLADEHASTSAPNRAFDLASALIKVARLVPGSRPRDLPLIALYRGEGVAGRIERLLRLPEPPAGSTPRRAWIGFAALALFPTTLALGLSGAFGLETLHAVHRLSETLVVLLQ